MKFGAHFCQDPIAKVKDFITELVNRLQAEALFEASQESDVEKHSSKLEAVVAPTFSTVRSQHFRRSLVPCRKASCRWTRFVQRSGKSSPRPKRMLSRESQECRRHFVNYWHARGGRE